MKYLCVCSALPLHTSKKGNWFIRSSRFKRVLALVVVVVALWVTGLWNRNRIDCELAVAVLDRNYDRVRQALQHRGDPNSMGRYPLGGVPVNCTEEAFIPSRAVYRPILLVAVIPRDEKPGDNGDVRIAQLLLKAGANPNVADRLGYIPIIVAAEYGNAEMVKLLLINHAKKDIQNQDGDTALQVAKRYQHEDVVKLLKSN